MAAIDVERPRETLEERTDDTAPSSFKSVRLVLEEATKEGGHALRGRREMADDVGNAIRDVFGNACRERILAVDYIERQQENAFLYRIQSINIDNVVLFKEAAFGDTVNDTLILGDEFFSLDAMASVVV